MYLKRNWGLRKTLPLIFEVGVFWVHIWCYTCCLFLQSGTTWYGQQPWEASDKDKLEMETQVDWGATNSNTHHEVEQPPAYDDVTGFPQQPTQQQQQQQQQPEEQLQVV